MNIIQSGKLSAFVMLLFAVVAVDVFAQNEPPKRVNFRYSQNPKTKADPAAVETENNNRSEKQAKTQATNDAEIPPTSSETAGSIAAKTFEIATRAVKPLPPTEIYKVGVGDILFVSLQNAPSGSATYFTVLNDGTIDYPIAVGTVSVAGHSTDEIEEIIMRQVKVIENPQVTVRVREYSSHEISVLGLVEKPGLKFLQREAVPLFVIRAESIVSPDANRVIIRRANSEIETFDLDTESYEKILVFSGDIVEFLNYSKPASDVKIPQFYYIGGNIRNVGQKDFYPGLSLTQAILASGGLIRAKEKTVIIRRKNAEGMLESTVYDLAEIKNGKVVDPLLKAGDTIEIGN